MSLTGSTDMYRRKFWFKSLKSGSFWTFCSTPYASSLSKYWVCGFGTLSSFILSNADARSKAPSPALNLVRLHKDGT